MTNHYSDQALASNSIGTVMEKSTLYHIFLVKNFPRAKTAICLETKETGAEAKAFLQSIPKKPGEKPIIVAHNYGRTESDRYVAATIGQSVYPHYSIIREPGKKPKVKYVGHHIYAVFRQDIQEWWRLVGLFQTKYKAWACKREEHQRRFIFSWQSILNAGHLDHEFEADIGGKHLWLD